MTKIMTRMGDGYPVLMTKEEIRADIEEGMNDVAQKRGISPLTSDDLERLLEICTMPSKLVGVERGNEVVLTTDGESSRFVSLASTGMVSSVQVWERAVGADVAEIGSGAGNFSYKTAKPAYVVHQAQKHLEEILHNTVLPMFFGSQPDLGLYTVPDGPFPNPIELMPLGKIAEARKSQEDIMEHAIYDMVLVGSHMFDAGVDGIDFDTTGASGDADFLAALKATKILVEKFPNLCVIMGMATESVLGMHGELYYEGVRLAGLRPHEQVKMAEKAGARIFGPAICTNTSRSFPWNLARAVTFTKTCSAVSSIPVHTNVGMGVGGMLMHEMPCPDTTSRAGTALVEIGKADGL